MRQILFYTLILPYFLTCTAGLQCYQCGYIQGHESDLPPEYFDASCMKGNTPKESFEVACKRNSSDLTDPVCTRIHVDGKMLDEKTVVMTLRGCMPELIIPGGCLRENVTSMSEIRDVPESFKEMLKLFKPDTLAELCTCRVHKCNAEESSGEGESSCTKLKVAKAVLILSTVLLGVANML